MTTIATVYGDDLGAPSTGAHQLTVVDGPDVGRAVRLDRAVVVGTDGGCELVLTDDRVSRTHLRLVPSSTGFEAEDLGSRNGTLYEGSRMGKACLPVGAALKLGRSVLRILPLARPLTITPSRTTRFGDLVGQSLSMRELFAVLELASGSDVTVLIEGETGTGKELAARALHDMGKRRRAPFVAINCSALPGGLIESELFGHVKGAFTGATNSRKGAFQRADGGTLFLDEMGSMPADVQARLLRVLEEGRVRPVGADREVAVDVRLVGASREDLDAQVADGRFRSDLFYRLAVLRVRLPALRERREDISLITEALLMARGLDGADVSGPALDGLLAHDWPGNVRELRNVIDRAIALSPGASNFASLRFVQAGGIGNADGQADAARGLANDLPWTEARQRVLDAFEREYLAALLLETDGNLSAASRKSGLDRKQLRTLARKHGLLP